MTTGVPTTVQTASEEDREGLLACGIIQRFQNMTLEDFGH